MSRKKVPLIESEEYFISPTIDSLFKRIFADMRSTAPLMSMLSSILKAQISEVSVTNPEIPRDAVDAKGNIMDIHAIINLPAGRQVEQLDVNIEMQCARK